jgi:outer membrane protein assembly factor BamA
LVSSYLGSSSLVRGHRLDVRNCAPDLTRVCGDELLGSRVLVGNVELRFPIWGVWSRQLDYGRIPVDAFLFADGGLVWSGPPAASDLGRHANGITSIGGGVRVNAGGLPFEIAAIRALDDAARPGWQTDFGFRVGF